MPPDFTTHGENFPAPVFVLSASQSHSALLCAMLGRHPGLYASPGLNLFAGQTVREFLEAARNNRRTHLSGALRTIAQLYAGEQTLESVEMARRWLWRRAEQKPASVMIEILNRIAPLRFIDRSLLYPWNADALKRIREAFPEARFLHLIRHPVDQGLAMIQSMEDAISLWQEMPPDPSGAQAPDPQYAWFQVHAAILEFSESLPDDLCHRLRVEDLLASPENSLRQLCEWLALPRSGEIFSAMLQPEKWVFAGPGPFNALGANNWETLGGTLESRGGMPSLDEALPWRPDKAGLSDSAKHLARALGYGAELPDAT